MAPLVAAIDDATPAFLAPAKPRLLGKVVDGGAVQSVGSTLDRYNVKLRVVPEPSERWTGVIFKLGKVTPGLSLTRAGSFQLVILPAKIWASVVPLKSRVLLTPLRL